MGEKKERWDGVTIVPRSSQQMWVAKLECYASSIVWGGGGGGEGGGGGGKYTIFVMNIFSFMIDFYL